MRGLDRAALMLEAVAAALPRLGVDRARAAARQRRSICIRRPAPTAATASRSHPGVYAVCESIPAGYTQSFPTGGADCSAHGGEMSRGLCDHAPARARSRPATTSGTSATREVGHEVRRPERRRRPRRGRARRRRRPDPPVRHRRARQRRPSAPDDRRRRRLQLHGRTGLYTVCETIPAGYVQSMPNSGPDCSGHDDAGGRGYAITLSSGEEDSGNDFGNFQPRQVGHEVRRPERRRRPRRGRTGLAGVEIHLFGIDGSGNAVHEHRTTGANGGYSFARPGATPSARRSRRLRRSRSRPRAPTAPHTEAASATRSPSAPARPTPATTSGTSVTRPSRARSSTTWTATATATSPSPARRRPDPPVRHRRPGTPSICTRRPAPTAATASRRTGRLHGLRDHPTGYTQSFPSTAGADCPRTARRARLRDYAHLGRGRDRQRLRQLPGRAQVGHEVRRPERRRLRRRGRTGHGRRRDPPVRNRRPRQRRPSARDDRRQRRLHVHGRPGIYTVCETIPTGFTQSFPSARRMPPAQPTAASATRSPSPPARTDRQRLRQLRPPPRGRSSRTPTPTARRTRASPGSAGWKIHLFGTDGLGNPVHEHAATAADGTYSFIVHPGSYTLCETVSASRAGLSPIPRQVPTARGTPTTTPSLPAMTVTPSTRRPARRSATGTSGTLRSRGFRSTSRRWRICPAEATRHARPRSAAWMRPGKASGR